MIKSLGKFFRVFYIILGYAVLIPLVWPLMLGDFALEGEYNESTRFLIKTGAYVALAAWIIILMMFLGIFSIGKG
jgi:hypothetical protein